MMSPGSLGLFGTWRDNLISASFREAQFYVMNSERTSGRTVRLSHYYGCDNNFIEDLGKASDEFMIEGYVIANDSNQNNYFTQRDKLINALLEGTAGTSNVSAHANKYGSISNIGANNGKPGTLKHPFYGEIDAYLKEPAKIVESFMEGGIARFTMTFIRWTETPPANEIMSIQDTIKSILNESLATYNDFVDSFSAWMNVGGAFMNSLGSIMRTVLGGVSKMISSVQGGIASTLSSASAITSGAMSFTNDILDSPCQMASTIGTGVDSILASVGIGGTAISMGVAGKCSGEMRGSIYKLDGSYIPEKLTLSCVKQLLIATQKDETSCTDPIPATQLDNAKAIVDLYQALVIRNACVIAVVGTYSSKDNAMTTMGNILSTIDTFLLRLGTRTMDVTMAYNAMENLRNTFTLCMLQKMESLEQVSPYIVPANGMNTLMLAYNKFSDISRCDEIYYMNKIGHPGFLPGGASINILDS